MEHKVIECNTLLVFMSLVSIDIYCSAEVKNTTLNIPIRSSLLYECLFEDEEYDEAKLDKALEEIEQIDPIEKVKISSLTDYSHIDSGVIRLGNGEGVTVTLETTPSGSSYGCHAVRDGYRLQIAVSKCIIPYGGHAVRDGDGSGRTNDIKCILPYGCHRKVLQLRRNR